MVGVVKTSHSTKQVDFQEEPLTLMLFLRFKYLKKEMKNSTYLNVDVLPIMSIKVISSDRCRCVIERVENRDLRKEG